jgi:hypothetical protein
MAPPLITTMDADQFAAMAQRVTTELAGKTIESATTADCGMGYCLTLHFTDGTSADISPEYDEGFIVSSPFKGF